MAANALAEIGREVQGNIGQPGRDAVCGAKAQGVGAGENIPAPPVPLP